MYNYFQHSVVFVSILKFFLSFLRFWQIFERCAINMPRSPLNYAQTRFESLMKMHLLNKRLVILIVCFVFVQPQVHA